MVDATASSQFPERFRVKSKKCSRINHKAKAKIPDCLYSAIIFSALAAHCTSALGASGTYSKYETRQECSHFFLGCSVE
jgi:hypothetical protein